MAERLRHFHGARVVRSIGADLARAHPRLAAAGFTERALHGLDALSLTGRAAHLAGCLGRHLPPGFDRAAEIIVPSLGPELPSTGSFGREPLLELLEDDPERYVRRSVANNLDDIAKDHPAVVADVCRRWSDGASPGRLWVVRRALRTLVERGDRAALAVVGADAEPEVSVRAVRLGPARPRIGGSFAVTLELVSTARHDQDLLVDRAGTARHNRSR